MKHEDCARSASPRSRNTCRRPPPRPRSRRRRPLQREPDGHAFLVQLPLPDGLDEEQALLAVDPAKDVDGLHPVNLGRLVMGTPGPLPCTPAGIVELLTPTMCPSKVATW